MSPEAGLHTAEPEEAVATPRMSLVELRARAGWSLRDAERETGISRGTLSRLERGLLMPSPEQFARLAHVYGADPTSWAVRILWTAEVDA